MKDELKNIIDDLLDEQTSKNLSDAQAIFPKTLEDFVKLNKEAEPYKYKRSEKLNDPLNFLNKRTFKRNKSIIFDSELQSQYEQNLSQAAREGKEISAEVRRRMIEDKQKSKGSNKEIE